MLQWLTDWWRGYSDTDMDRVNLWDTWGSARPLPAQMTKGEYWAYIAKWDRNH